MKDEYTQEQKERLQQQDEFLGAVAGAKEGVKKYGRSIKGIRKVKTRFIPGMKNNAEGKAVEKNVDVNQLEKIYQQNKKDLNDENVVNKINPNYQSPREDQKTKSLKVFRKTVKNLPKKQQESVNKVLGD